MTTPERPPTTLDRIARAVRIGVPGRPTPAGERFVRLVAPLARLLFRPALEGLERLPVGRPFLLVANHSGMGICEIAALAVLWVGRAGDDEAPARRVPLTGLAHPLGFVVPGAGAFLRNAGAIPSTYEHAGQALEGGASVLVFPGGDHEAMRPLWQARRVDFHGRAGFARLARRAGVPVVPLGIRGSHVTVPILWRSALLPLLLVLPRLAGLKRLPLTIPWLVGTALFAWGLRDTPGWAALAVYLWWWFPLVYFLPLVPSRITFHLGAPLEPGELFPTPGPSAEDAAARRIEAEVQALVDPGRPKG